MMKTRSWLIMMSLIGMMSLVGCPTDGGGGGNDKKDTEVKSGIIEEYIGVTLNIPYPIEGPGRFEVPITPTFSGVENPEKITKVTLLTLDSNDWDGLHEFIFPKEIPEEYKSDAKNFNIHFERDRFDPTKFVLIHGRGNRDFGQAVSIPIKLYLKYEWTK